MRPFGRGFSRDGDLHDYKESVRVATIAALAACTAAGSGFGKTLTADANGTLTVDGVLLVAGDRVLVKNQVAGADNGIYVVTAAGVAGGGGSPWILTRAVDFDDAADVTAGAMVPIEDGTLAEGVWQLATNNPITLDTSVLTFTMGPAGFVPTTRTLTAGGGLTGGGDLSADRTFDVGAGTGITVNADDVAVDQATAFAWMGDHSWGLSAAPAPGVDSRHIRFIGQTSAGLRNIDIRNEADAGTDTYRLRINDNGGNPMVVFDAAGIAGLTYVNGGAVGQQLQLYLDSATPVGGDVVGDIQFYGNDDTPAKKRMGGVECQVTLNTAGASRGQVYIYSCVNGAISTNLQIAPGLVTANGPLSVLAATSTVTYINNGAVGPTLELRHTRTNDGVANDEAGTIDFYAWDDAGAGGSAQQFGRIQCLAVDVVSGSEDGAFLFQVPIAGSAVTTILRLDRGNSYFYTNFSLAPVGEPIVSTGGADSYSVRLSGYANGTNLRNIDILNECDAGADTYRLRINNNAGAQLAVFGTTAAGLRTFGLFGSEAVQPAALVQTYATADRTLAADTAADLGAFTGGAVGFLNAAERDNIRTQFNALRVDMDDLKQFVNSLVDDLQGLGLEQ